MATKILIVDDQLDRLDTTLVWLRQDGYEVLTAEKGDQALRLAEQTPPDLVLLSMAMPGLDGRDIARWLRRNPATRRVPIILITDLSGENAAAEVAQAEANGFVTRPVQLPDVQRRVDMLLHVESPTVDDNRRLLEDTCHAALTILPCNLAWMLTAEQAALVSQAIATDQGQNAGAVFLRLVGENRPGQPSFPLEPGNNPLSEAALRANPLVNIPTAQLQDAPGGQLLYRAFKTLRLAYVHFVPLQLAGQIIGMLVLAAKDAHDVMSTRGQQILNALTNQAATVANNARLVRDLAASQEQMKAEQAFRKMILDTMGDGLAVIDEQAVIQYANTRLLRLSGYSRQELTGASIALLFPPTLREHMAVSLRRQSRATVNFSQQLYTKDGRIVPVLMSRATAGTADWNTVLVFTDLTEQRQREHALERQSIRLQTLNRAVQALSSALTVDDVFMVFAQSAAEIVQCANACLFVADGRQPDTLRVAAAAGQRVEAIRGSLVALGEGIAGQVAQNQRPQLAPSVLSYQGALLPIEQASRALIAVPLTIMEEVIGVLEVFDDVEGQFIQGDVEMLENLSAAAAIAVENVRLLEETQRRVSELSTLLEASSAVSSTLDIASILELLARRLAEALNVGRCSILMWDRPANRLTMLAEVCNASWPLEQGPVRPIAATPLSIAAMKSGKLAIAHLDDPALHPQIREQLKHLRMRSVLLMPLRLSRSGIVELYSSKDRQDFTPELIQSLEEGIARWLESANATWYTPAALTDLFQLVAHAADAGWYAVSAWDRHEPVARAVREIGFALWKEGGGGTYRLEEYPIMAQVLTQDAPVSLHTSGLAHDPYEHALMAQAGMHSGLIVPLLVRGEASGLIKLLDASPERDFDFTEISLCQGIANVLSSAIQSAQLYQSLARRASALQAAYDELRQADRVKDDLIQNLSHELQTPLHQIIMQLDLLANEALGPLSSEQKEHMEVIMNKITQVAGMIRDMLSLKTLDAEQLDFAEARTEEIVEGAIRSLLPQATGAGLHLVAAIAPNIPGLWADAPRITQVIEQLIENAIKFSPRTERKANRIEVRVEDTNGAMVRFSVQDYGIGIPQQEFENIFQRGYQVDGSLTRRFGGAGLGLSLARQIVEAHGGKIWVESAPGLGSQFHFTIPKVGVKFQLGQPEGL